MIHSGRHSFGVSERDRCAARSTADAAAGFGVTTERGSTETSTVNDGLRANGERDPRWKVAPSLGAVGATKLASFSNRSALCYGQVALPLGAILREVA
jgi:hypothetical protein